MTTIFNKIMVRAALRFFDITNCYIIKYSENDLAIVDPGGQYTKIRDEIDTLGGALRRVILTHGHPDHWLALPELLDNHENFKVIFHENDEIFFREEGINAMVQYYSTDIFNQIKNMDTTEDKKEREHRHWSNIIQRVSQRILDRANSIDWNRMESITNETEEINLPIGDGKQTYTMKILHTPGHSEGSISLYTNEKMVYGNQILNGIIFSGDLLMHKNLGNTSLPYSNTEDLHRSITHQIFDNQDIKNYYWLFPGHSIPFAIRCAKEFYLARIISEKRSQNELAFS